jgi:hypothetical protein
MAEMLPKPVEAMGLLSSRLSPLQTVWLAQRLMAELFAVKGYARLAPASLALKAMNRPPTPPVAVADSLRRRRKASAR